MDIACPFEFCRVGVPGAYVAGLELLELLLGAEFVGLCGGVVRLWWVVRGVEERGGVPCWGWGGWGCG